MDITHENSDLITVPFDLLREELLKRGGGYENVQELLFGFVEGGNSSGVRVALLCAADVNGKTTSSWTALMIAAEHGHKEIVEVLIGNNADVNAKSTGGATALMIAAECGHEEIVKILIDNNADVNAEDRYGYTAIDVAKYYGHSSIVEILELARLSQRKVSVREEDLLHVFGDAAGEMVVKIEPGEPGKSTQLGQVAVLKA